MKEWHPLPSEVLPGLKTQVRIPGHESTRAEMLARESEGREGREEGELTYCTEQVPYGGKWNTAMNTRVFEEAAKIVQQACKV